MDLTLLIADSGLIFAWAISIVLTLLLIAVPALYLAVLTFAMDESAFDRTVRDIEQQVKIKRRAQAYSGGRDVFNVLEQAQ